MCNCHFNMYISLVYSALPQSPPVGGLDPMTCSALRTGPLLGVNMSKRQVCSLLPRLFSQHPFTVSMRKLPAYTVDNIYRPPLPTWRPKPCKARATPALKLFSFLFCFRNRKSEIMVVPWWILMAPNDYNVVRWVSVILPEKNSAECCVIFSVFLTEICDRGS